MYDAVNSPVLDRVDGILIATEEEAGVSLGQVDARFFITRVLQ